jgi:hypothetical protein
MKLVPIVKSILVESVSIEQIRDKVVGEDKPISPDIFDEIIKVSNNKINYILFLVNHVVKKNLLPEDVYKFQDYFNSFNKNKAGFPIKDLGQIKSAEDLSKFKQIAQEFIDQRFQKGGGSGKILSKHVSPGKVKSLEEVGIKLIGIVDDYQVFQVTQEAANEQGFKRYKNILGKCSTDENGKDDEESTFNDEKIKICTFGIGYYMKYLTEDYPGSSYFVLFNLEDPKSPYQIHFESGQFMDRADNSMI